MDMSLIRINFIPFFILHIYYIIFFLKNQKVFLIKFEKFFFDFFFLYLTIILYQKFFKKSNIKRKRPAPARS